jgi:hypothetical protein
MLGAICGVLNYFLLATKGAIVQGVKEGCNNPELKMIST